MSASRRRYEFLRRQAEAGEDLEHLCWARLALDAYADLPGIRETWPRLEKRIRAAHAARAGRHGSGQRRCGWP